MSSAVVKVIVYVAVATVYLQAVGGAPVTIDMKNKYEDTMQRQTQELKSLGCTPVLQKIMLADGLEIHDALADKIFFPQVVAVRRCDEECSFCGDHNLGRTKGSCLPDPEGVRERRVIVFYYEEGKRHYRTVLLDEHTSCKCS